MRTLIALLLTVCVATAFAQSDPCHSTLSSADKGDFDKGVEAYNNKKYAQSLSIMKRVSQRNRTAPDPYFYMGVCAVKTGERPAVIRNHFNRLFKLCPDYPNALAYYYMGVVHYSYKEYGDAVTYLDRYFQITNQQPNPAYDAVYEEASTYLYWSEFLSEAQQNQVPFYPAVVRRASSTNDEYHPYLTPDGKELYFVRAMREKGPQSFYTHDNQVPVARLCLSRKKDTLFSDGTPLNSPFNSDNFEGPVSATADGRTLFITLIKNDKGYRNSDIYSTRLTDGKWGPMTNAGRNVNGQHTFETHPTVSPDGSCLIFVSDRDGGYGGTDLWMCRRLPNGDWSRAENLGPAVNTRGNERYPFLHADGRTLYFASDGWQGFGGSDIYFIDITNPTLQRPTNMGLPINTESDDVAICVAADGHNAYFANKSADWKGVGGTDIFCFELYPAARPTEMAVVRGRMRSTGGEALRGSVDILAQRGHSQHYIVDSTDGSFAIAIPARGNNLILFTSEGHMPRVVTGNAAKVNRDLQAADFLLSPIVASGRYPIAMPTALPLNADAIAILDAYADFLIENPRIRIRVEAATLQLAQAIHDHLLSRQLRPERLTYKQTPTLSAPVFVVTTQ